LVIALNNPSQITISAGDLVFDVIMDATGSSVGSVTLANTVIKPGRNEMPASMKMTGTDLAALSRLLTNYLTGQTTALTVKGTSFTSKITPLQPGLAQLALKTNMVGIPASLVVENEMQIVNLFGNPHIWVKFNNPLDTQYTVAGISANVFFTNAAGVYTQLGSLVGAVSPPVTVPAHGQATNQNYLELKLSSLANGLGFLTLPADKKFVDLYQNVSVIVGDAFHGGMYYEQKHVPVVDRNAAATAQAVSQALINGTLNSSIIPSVSASVPVASGSVPVASGSVPVVTTSTDASVTTTVAAATTTTDAPATTTSAAPAPTTITEPTVTTAGAGAAAAQTSPVLPF
jgi:hypothetical protein